MCQIFNFIFIIIEIYIIFYEELQMLYWENYYFIKFLWAITVSIQYRFHVESIASQVLILALSHLKRIVLKYNSLF